MDKKKISTGLKIAGFICAIVALVAMIEPFAFSGRYVSGMSLLDMAFRRGTAWELIQSEGFKFHYNAIYIVAFILVLIALLAVAGALVAHFTGKGSAQLNKALVIAAIVSLVIAAIFAFCGKGIIRGEIFQNTKATKKAVDEMMKFITLGKGSICLGVFGIVGAGSLALGAKLDK